MSSSASASGSRAGRRPIRVGRTRASAAKGWCFTLNNPTAADIEAFKELWTKVPEIDFVVFQLESGAAGTPHLQGYLHSKKRVRRTPLLALLPSHPHVEIARGTAKQNVAYCSKEEGRLDGPWIFGNCPSEGKGALMDHLWQAVLSDRPIYDAIDEVPGLLNHQRAYTFAREVALRKKGNVFRNVTVEVLWGPPGVGKTSLPVLAHGGYEDIYIATKLLGSTLWFDGYVGQKVLIMDDFPWVGLSYRALLRLLDGHPLDLPVKGGFVPALYTHVYITCNDPIQEWYPKQGDRRALERRVSRVLQFDPFGIIWWGTTRLGHVHDVYGPHATAGGDVGSSDGGSPAGGSTSPVVLPLTDEVVPGTESGGNTPATLRVTSPPDSIGRLPLRAGSSHSVLARQDGFIHPSPLRRDALLLQQLRRGQTPPVVNLELESISFSSTDSDDDGGSTIEYRAP